MDRVLEWVCHLLGEERLGYIFPKCEEHSEQLRDGLLRQCPSELG